jgi:hypothetical protein
MERKSKTVGLSSLLAGLIVALAGCSAGPRDRVLLREYAGSNYCHMKIETDGTDPVRYERDVVDYYGPCDEVADSRDRRIERRRYEQNRYGRDYRDR